jgi:uncharacterized membrane protein/mono/diheme cytochrome c family protein
VTDFFDQTLVWLGRLHPLLVHLPIGFLILLAILECAAGTARFRAVAAARPIVLVASVLSALVSAACGWLLAGQGDYAAQALAWHRWLGTALVPALLVLGVLARSTTAAYRLGLLGTLVLLVAASHFGGVLVRGENYLFPWLSAKSDPGAPDRRAGAGAEDAAAPSVYAALIQPVFDQYCIGCHGPGKAKAHLRLDSAEHVFAGGDSGAVIAPGNAAQSLLIKRLRLPLEADEHMPPDGKPQPRPEQIALLEWWIRVGAPTNRLLMELSLPNPQ